MGAFLSLSPFVFLLSLTLGSCGTANVPDSTSLSSTLLRSNLVEFSWVDILLSSRAYLYLAFESSGPFARFANCTIALAFYALRKKKEKERKGEAFSPSFPIRDGGLSLYFGFARLTEDAEDPYPLRRGIRETEATGKGLSFTPRGIHGRTRALLLIYIGRLAYFVIYC